MIEDFKRAAGGQFAPGTKPGPGRKPGRPDLYLLAERMAEAEGYKLDDALWRMFKKLIAIAEAGDVPAMKLAFDHLGLPAKQILELQQRGGGKDALSVEEIERRVASLVATANARAAAATQRGKLPATNGQHAAPDA